MIINPKNVNLEKISSLVTAINNAKNFDDGSEYIEGSDSITYEGRLLYLLRQLLFAVAAHKGIKINEGAVMNVCVGLMDVVKKVDLEVDLETGDVSAFKKFETGSRYAVALSGGYNNSSLDVVVTDRNRNFKVSMYDNVLVSDYLRSKVGDAGKFKAYYNENGLELKSVLEKKEFNDGTKFYSIFANNPLSAKRCTEVSNVGYKVTETIESRGRILLSDERVYPLTYNNSFNSYESYVVSYIPNVTTDEFGRSILVSEETLVCAFPEVVAAYSALNQEYKKNQI